MEVKIPLSSPLSLCPLFFPRSLAHPLWFSLSAIELTAEIMEVTPTPRGTKSVLQPLTDTVCVSLPWRESCTPESRYSRMLSSVNYPPSSPSLPFSPLPLVPLALSLPPCPLYPSPSPLSRPLPLALSPSPLPLLSSPLSFPLSPFLSPSPLASSLVCGRRSSLPGVGAGGVCHRII
jgi:hypothetical protein